MAGQSPGWRGSAKGEDKDSSTVAPRTAVRRLAGEGEDKDRPTSLIFPRSTTPPRRVWLPARPQGAPERESPARIARVSR